MNNTLLSLLVTTALIASPVIAADSYDYIETPIPNQIDDLLDEDKDGVINARDLCPQTPTIAEVDNDGCATYIKTQQQMDLHILFANDSAQIQPAFLAQIREMSAFLDTYPSTSIELRGYASKIGNSQYNLALSERRAQAVEDALLSNGVASQRVRIIGFGDAALEAYGDDEISHARNRKVVATVIGHKGSVKEQWTIFTTIEK
ncbi:OmpA family protein [Vibrio salilacus]|uniref:OmpA family protein n=1 Tax=Vibrio salilacus TaxID=1323749 RepID=UPI000C296125|nr:OmpA family protein [Vibrio salilacus]